MCHSLCLRLTVLLVHVLDYLSCPTYIDYVHMYNEDSYMLSVVVWQPTGHAGWRRFGRVLRINEDVSTIQAITLYFEGKEDV